MRRVPIMPIRRRIALVVLACLFLVAPPAVTQAAFPGKPGPLVYPRVNLNESGDTGGLLLHGPRQKQKPHRLTSNPTDEAPSFSANGRFVVFSTIAEQPAAAAGRHIYVVKVDGTGLRQLTTGPSFDSNPSFSPNGKQIVFDRHPGAGKSHVFAINVDGSGLRQLTNGNFNDSEPVYVPNGKRIVFVSDRDHDVKTDRSDIFAMAPSGANQRVLIDGPYYEKEPDTAPNGKGIAFVSNRRPGINIFVAGAGGRDVRQLTHNKRDCFSGSCNLSPAWSPDGRHIACLAVGRYSSDLEVMRADGSGAKEFSDGGTEPEGFGTRVGAPSWGAARP
jgi:Tol biopolymer transport system component